MPTQTGSIDLKSIKKAYEAETIAGDTNQYFWFKSTGSDTGAHITEIPQDLFLNNPTGGNVLVRSNGLAIRKGLTELATFSADGLQVMADDGVTQIAHLGYGPGTSQGGGTSDAPYYTLGTRTPNSTVGNYSVSEGQLSDAVGYACHAEGSGSAAGGKASHAEGFMCTAGADYSHAQNEGTYTAKKAQTVIGTFNAVDTGSMRSAYGDYPFIIGNGIQDNMRKNAFAVDWLGRVQCGDYGGNLKSIFDIFYPVGSYYETSDTTFNPATAWGGTWELEVAGQVHVSAGTGYTVAGALTNTTDGGEKEHTLTVNEMPAHSHIRNRNNGYDNNFATGSGRTIPTNNSVGNQGNIRTADTGGGQAHNNMPPYIVVNRWHRTA